ncbi:MAG: hypothetical protein AAGH38_08860 [Pseudomonadota bacterium]
MTTRINPLRGRHFNDPSIAASISPLVQAFTPPSASEQHSLVRANNERAEGQRKAQLWAAAGDDFDKRSIVADLYNPTQSFYAVDSADATARRGQDIAAETSRHNNAADSAAAYDRATLEAIAGLGGTVLEHGEAISGIPDDVAEALGISSFPSQTGADLDAPAPLLSEDEVEAQLLQVAIDEGLFSPEEVVAERRSNVPVETIVTPDGPRFVSRGDAVGQEPYINRGAQAAPELETYRTPEGLTGTAEYDVDQRVWVDTQTREVLPEGTVTGKINDTSEGFGATTSNVTRGNAIVAEAQYALERVSAFRDLLEQNPGIMGIPGMIRGLAQDVVAAADEAGAAFGSIDSVEEARELAARIGASGDYDPAFAQAAAYALEMAYLQAKAQDPGGEVNVRELERILGHFDGGIAGNSKVLAVLDALEPQLHDRITYGQQLRGETESRQDGVATPPSLSDAALFRKYGLE